MGGTGQRVRWRLILTIFSLAALGGGAIYAATIAENDVALGGLVSTATTCAAGLASGLGKLIEKD